MAQPFQSLLWNGSGEPANVAKGVMNDGSTWHMDASASKMVCWFSAAAPQVTWS